MAKSSTLVLYLSVFIFIITEPAMAQTCSSYQFSSNTLFQSCNDLPVLDSFLHYTYDSSSSNLQVAYRHTNLSRKWVAWAVNPSSTGMVGAQSIVAYPQSDVTVRAYTSPISSYHTILQEGELSFNVSELSATYQNNEMIIYATLSLPLANGGNINIVWQDGSLSGNSLLPHPTYGNNIRSVSTMNSISSPVHLHPPLEEGKEIPSLENATYIIHGILNAVSWGIMMLIEEIIARYLRVSKSAGPAWFYLHVYCQASADIIGVAGWATGLKLASESAGIQFSTHRAISISLFYLATVQVFAMFLRPKPEHKYKLFWKIYHHTVGYTVIVLAVVNVFKGLEILSPGQLWRNAYTAVIVMLGLVAAVLEGFTWYVVIKRGNKRNLPRRLSLETVLGLNTHRELVGV